MKLFGFEVTDGTDKKDGFHLTMSDWREWIPDSEKKRNIGVAVYEFRIGNYKDALEYHKGKSCTISLEQDGRKFPDVSAVCIYKRKQKDGSSIVKFRVVTEPAHPKG